MSDQAGTPSDLTPNAQSSNPVDPTKLPPVHVALVLSGGGAKGDFEVGAVRCLYNNGVRPEILCGTSVGSVNALKLAEGEDSKIPGSPPSGYVRGLRGLEKIWLSLQNDGDMWSLEPGVKDVFDTLENKLPKEMATLESEASDLTVNTIGGFAASLAGIPGFLGFLPQAGDLLTIHNQLGDMMTQLTTTLQDAENLRGFINYDPLGKLMRAPTSFFPPAQASSGIKLRLAMVALEDGALRYVNEQNQMIERDGSLTPLPPQPTAAQIQQLQGQIADLKASIAAQQPKSPGQTNLGPVQKPTPGLTAQVNKLASMENQLERWQSQVKPDILRAAIASSSLPLICRPTTMQDGRTYIDGGIRTLAPIEAAIQAGATKVFAVAAGSQKFDSETMDQITGSTPLPMLGIALRVGIAILPDEVARRDLSPPTPWPVPVVVIQPDPALDDIHDGLTLEPGLIRIRMAYGFMRAYDTLRASAKSPKGYAPLVTENSDKGKTIEIIKLRKKIWDAEFPANGKAIHFPSSPFPPQPYTVQDVGAPNQAMHDQVRQWKLQLSQLIQARMDYYADPTAGLTGAESLPDDFETWSTQWEAHNWTPVVAL